MLGEHPGEAACFLGSLRPRDIRTAQGLVTVQPELLLQRQAPREGGAADSATAPSPHARASYAGSRGLVTEENTAV